MAQSTYHGAYEEVAGAGSRILLVADHASNALPGDYQGLGLPGEVLQRHVGYDVWIAETTRILAARLGAGAILAGFSRLLIDANRGEDDPTLIMQISDGTIIPGNVRLSPAAIERRLNKQYRPYHSAIDRALDRLQADGWMPILVSMHSFTPEWRGRPRPWHCGVLSGRNRLVTDYLLHALRGDAALIVGDNEPYAGGLPGDCLDRHGANRGVPHGLIEIRQDLIATETGRSDWVRRLVPILTQLEKEIVRC